MCEGTQGETTAYFKSADRVNKLKCKFIKCSASQPKWACGLHIALRPPVSTWLSFRVPLPSQSLGFNPAQPLQCRTGRCRTARPLRPAPSPILQMQKPRPRDGKCLVSCICSGTLTPAATCAGHLPTHLLACCCVLLGKLLYLSRLHRAWIAWQNSVVEQAREAWV